MWSSRFCLVGTLIVAVSTGVATAQRRPVPRPFPTPGAEPAQPPPPPTELPVTAPAPAEGEVPTEATLGVPIYPNTEYLTSYDAGRGQHLHLFGTNATFQDMVGYYSAVLDERGDRVFDAPATHQFDTARFRDDRMSYRPSVTIKDYTWNGSEGYLNPRLGAEPERFITLIQITTAPPGEAER